MFFYFTLVCKLQLYIFIRTFVIYNNYYVICYYEIIYLRHCCKRRTCFILFFSRCLLYTVLFGPGGAARFGNSRLGPQTSRVLRRRETAAFRVVVASKRVKRNESLDAFSVTVFRRSRNTHDGWWWGLGVGGSNRNSRTFRGSYFFIGENSVG